MELKESLKDVLKTKNSASIRQMFDTIAPKYDLLNHLLSFNIDKYWRKKAIEELTDIKAEPVILDLATGTGDLAKEIIQAVQPYKLIAVDISSPMLEVAKHKLGSIKTSTKILLKLQAVEDLKVNDDSIDAVTIAFGVRNFNNLEIALCKIHKALKPNAKLIILEFSKSKNIVVDLIHKFYLSKILPLIGRIVSGHDFAYNYLVDSVQEFPAGEKFLVKIREAGFYNTSYKPLTFGICSIYVAYKKPNKVL